MCKQCAEYRERLQGMLLALQGVERERDELLEAYHRVSGEVQKIGFIKQVAESALTIDGIPIIQNVGGV